MPPGWEDNVENVSPSKVPTAPTPRSNFRSTSRVTAGALTESANNNYDLDYIRTLSPWRTPSDYLKTGVRLMVRRRRGSLPGPTTSRGAGTAVAILNTTTEELNWSVNYHGLSGAAVSAHIHGPSDPGENSVPQVDIGKSALEMPHTRVGQSDGPGGGANLGWQVVRECSHRSQPWGRNSRPT